VGSPHRPPGQRSVRRRRRPLLFPGPAFSEAYLQRLGLHAEEARRTIDQVTTGELLPWLATEGRESAAAELQIRLDALVTLQQQLADAPSVFRPLTLIRHGEWSIAERTASHFVPVVPLDLASLAWTGIGIVAAAVFYELVCRAPIEALRWRRERGRLERTASTELRRTKRKASPEPRKQRPGRKQTKAGPKKAPRPALPQGPDRDPAPCGPGVAGHTETITTTPAKVRATPAIRRPVSGSLRIHQENRTMNAAAVSFSTEAIDASVNR
jgi:hypothetical protein